MIGVLGRIELTAQDLSNRMLEDGLPRNIANIKLFACLAGAVAPADAGKVLESFGARFYFSLVTRGVDTVRVTAYTVPLTAATVNPMTGHKRTMVGDRPSAHSKSWPN